MILYYSSHLRIFNGDGFQKEKLLLLKMFSNFSIKKYLKILKTLKKGLFLSFDLSRYIQIKITKIISDFTLVKNIKKGEEKLLQSFILKKLIAFYLIRIFQKILNEKFIWLNLLKDLEETNSVLNKNITSKKNAFFLEVIPTYLSFESLTTFKLSKKLNFSFKLKKELYRKEYSFFSKFKENINNINNRSIFIIGKSWGLYPGTYTPFLSSKLNWFVSTGLKSDIECQFLHFFDKVDPREAMSEKLKQKSMYGNIIFKVNNLKKKIIKIKHMQKIERNSFLYTVNTNYGTKGFMGESKLTFNLKANYLFTFNQNLFLEKINFNKIYLKINNGIFYKNFKNIFKESKLRYLNNYSISLNIKREKFYFILFKLSKSILDYYFLLENGLEENLKECFDFYRSLIFFSNITKKNQTSIKHLFSLILKNFLKKGYKLKSNKNFSFYDSRFLINIFHIYFINLNFIERLNKHIGKTFFYNFYFNIFLMKKKVRKENIMKKKGKYHRYFLSNALLSIYKSRGYPTFISYYFKFLLEWRINFNILFLSETKGIILKETCFNEKILEYENLKKKWSTEGEIYIKELIYFILDLINRLCVSLKKLLYFSFYTKTTLNKRFFLLNSYLYFEKLIKKDSLGEEIALDNTIFLSSLFLGKWFYYRQIHRFFDNNFDYNYALTRKPPRFLNTSLLESQYYNLKFTNKNKMVGINFKLDMYFNKLKKGNLKKILINLDSKEIRKKAYDIRKANVFLNLKGKVTNYLNKNLFKFRQSLFFKRFTNSYDNFLKINYRIKKQVVPELQGRIKKKSQILQKWKKFDLA